MLLSFLILIPFIGVFLISTNVFEESNERDINYCKSIALITSIITLILSLIIYMLFDFSTNQFQFVQENYNIKLFDIYLGIDGLSIYFVLLTTIIIPIALLSN